LIAELQRRLIGFDNKILALYAEGITARDIGDIDSRVLGLP
jgi:hypothetical protein